MRIVVAAVLLLALGACSGEKPCPAPAPHWQKVAAADSDIITLDAHDRILWNGEITSLERLRDTLNKADASGRSVALIPDPAASCGQIQTIRLAMERSLACPLGRCAEVPPL